METNEALRLLKMKRKLPSLDAVITGLIEEASPDVMELARKRIEEAAKFFRDDESEEGDDE